MAKPLSRAAKRLQVARRAGFLCEYCRSPDGHSTHAFSLEHAWPKAKDGGDDLDNLVLSCQGCNNHKYTHTEAVDPQTGEVVPLFNPRIQVWEQHFTWSEDHLEVRALTAIGRAAIALLHLNRERLRTLRRTLAVTQEHPALRQNSE